MISPTLYVLLVEFALEDVEGDCNYKLLSWRVLTSSKCYIITHALSIHSDATFLSKTL